MRKLSLELLESRKTPAIAYSAADHIWGNGQISPIPGFFAPLSVATVENSDPAPGHNPDVSFFAAPASDGGPRLISGDFQGNVSINEFVFEPTFFGGVSLDADRRYVVVGAGQGGGPRVKVLDSHTGSVLADFFAYSPDFRGGVRVALADLPDGSTEIITGTGVGGVPNVRVFDITGKQVASFAVDSDEPSAGVRVACVFGQVVTLAGHTLTSYSLAGFRVGAETPVLDDVTSLGRDYFSSNLVQHVTLGTAEGNVLEYDLNASLFPKSRLIVNSHVANAPLYVGNVTQLDGVARFNLTGGLNSLSDTVFNEELAPPSIATLSTADYPLGSQVSPTPAGYAIGELDGGTGTLTGYVQGADGKIYALTNHHVVSSIPSLLPPGTPGAGDTYVGKPVYQPGPAFPDPTQFGTVAAWTPAVNGATSDSALIAVSNYDPRTAYTDISGNVGYIQTHGTGTVSVGDLVYKFGFWGCRMEIVVAMNQTVQIQQEDGSIITMPGQIVFASAENGISALIPGDSGSALVSYAGALVGQDFAGNLVIGLASPIQTVEANTGTHPLN